MDLILWIDHNTFALSLLERVFRKEGLSFYSLDNAGDFVYLVEDLHPRLIVLDCDTAHKDLEKLRAQYEQSELLREALFVIVGEGRDLDFITNKVADLQRPFDPFEIPQKIKEILNQTQV